MARIFLTGASGQVGRDIEFALLKQGDVVISSTHRTLDITNLDDVMSAISSSNADLVINAAAYTNVEKSEDESAIAVNVNALGPRNLAKACLSCNIPLIHISTDYVFSGGKRKEHVETDPTKVECEYGRSKLDGERNIIDCNIPLIHISTDYVFSGGKRKEHVETDPTKVECEYGRSKLDGERNIIDSGCKHLIVRTSWLFGCFGRNFVKIMLSMVQERSEVAVVCDQLGNPTPVRPLAECLVKMANRVLSDKDFDNWGIYHFCGYEPTTWDNFARAIFANANRMGLLDHSVNVVSISSRVLSDKDFDNWGIYHFCGYEPTTWDNFARAIFANANRMGLLDHSVNVVSISSEEFKSKAKRPADSRLNCDKIASVFGVKLPYWEDYLGEVIHAFYRERQGLTPVEDYDHTISIIDHITNAQELFAIVKQQEQEQEQSAAQEGAEPEKAQLADKSNT